METRIKKQVEDLESEKVTTLEKENREFKERFVEMERNSERLKEENKTLTLKGMFF